MKYLPINVDVTSAACLVVGGGEVALRKSTMLARAHAHVVVVSPKIHPELKALLEDTQGVWLERRFEPRDVDSKKLVIAATEINGVNLEVYQAAVSAGVLVNVVDDPAHCQFIFPAIVDRDPIVIGITSSGQAPVLARYLRAKIESLVPKRYDKLAQMAGQFRDTVKQKLNSGSLRRQYWESIFSGPAVERVISGQMHEAKAILAKTLEEYVATQSSDSTFTSTVQAEVYLVGAGPGDPDLLTFKALRLMQQCDVVVYDRLVSADIMDLVRRDAERIYAGKKPNDHSIPQDEINLLLVRLAKEGKRVCRLKGGDPFIFGRGGEEIDQLAQAGINFQVVPGITAANGCSAYAGIPLTHRDHAQSVRFVTGHLKAGQLDLPWKSYCQENETLVFYMGLISLPIIASSLIAAGKKAETPVAVVANGTRPKQQVVVGTLQSIIELVSTNGSLSPSLIIIGHVVNLHSNLSWFQNKML